MIPFIKFLLIIFVNLLFGLTPLFIIIGFLFYPNRKIYFRDKKIPLTPGFLYRKKEQLMHKIHRMLYDYLGDCEKIDERTRIAKWERKAYSSAYNRFQWISDIRWIPSAITNKIHQFVAKVVYEIVRQFLRKLVPFLLEKYKLESYFEIINQKLDIEIVKEFFMRYVFKWIIILLLVIYGIIGLLNGFLFLIIK